ncbi:MAG: ketol-acid reductoisomerase [Alphaproteobacteria bacterium]
MKMLRDEDADLSFLRDKTVAIIGYGNQGRAQALNLRDSGVAVVIGAIRDETSNRAEDDGFEVLPIADAAERADIIALLIPDEIQPKVHEEHIADKLRSGKVLDFAHGFNIHFGLIAPPSEIDVVMVAPRMLGEHVRSSFENGRGAPAYIAVAQDASGHARDIALAWAKGIGATRAGVLETSFAQEAELDLFTEQATWPIIIRDLILSYETLVEAGFPPEMVALELYGSGEASEVFRQMARRGLFGQMRLHSQTSQYGTLSRAERMLPDEDRARFREALEDIRSGRFAKEWTAEQESGYPKFKELRARATEHSLNEAEQLALEAMKRSGLA